MNSGKALFGLCGRAGDIGGRNRTTARALGHTRVSDRQVLVGFPA